MNNLLIVDDEISVREHLKLMLAGTPYRLREAANGWEALQLVKEQRPDVLITDIRMPKMDGIRLIHESLLEHPGLRSIVLSNYAEFNLAQQAIRTGANNYLLKATLTKEELLQEIERLLREKTDNRRWDVNERTTITNALFHERFNNRISTAELVRRANKHDIPFFAARLDRIAYFLMQVNRFGAWLRDKFQGEADLAVYSVMNMASEILKDVDPRYEMFHVSEGRFIVVGPHEPEGRMETVLSDLQRALSEIFELTMSAVHGYVSEGLDRFFQSAQASLSDYDHLFYAPYGTIVHRESLTPSHVATEVDFYRYFMDLLSSKEEWVRYEQLPIWIESLLGVLATVRRKPEYVKEDLQLLITCIEKSGYTVEQPFQKSLQRLDADHIAEYRTLFKAWLQQNRFFRTYQQEMTKAIQYVHEHYNEKIALDDVCAEVNLSRSHFSKVFKEQFGVTLMEYVEMFRMNQARMLLKTTTFSIGEIAGMIGVPDIFYFSKMYKRRFQVTPSKDR